MDSEQQRSPGVTESRRCLPEEGLAHPVRPAVGPALLKLDLWSPRAPGFILLMV
jgi:hypothetical protein